MGNEECETLLSHPFSLFHPLIFSVAVYLSVLSLSLSPPTSPYSLSLYPRFEQRSINGYLGWVSKISRIVTEARSDRDIRGLF